MSEEREIAQLRSTIEFGLDAAKFMSSSLGRYLIDRANTDIETALNSLKTADAEDPKAIRKLQNDVAAAERFLLWMGEAVTDGENAERQFIDSSD